MSQGKRAPLSERFWEHVAKGEGCWLWTGGKNNAGYGLISAKRDGRHVMITAHRLSWEMHNGPVPVGVHVLHRCDTPVCVNPAHLFLGTNAENVADRDRKERGGTAKITRAQAEEIRSLRGSESSRALAERFHVTDDAIRDIWRGRTWRAA